MIAGTIIASSVGRVFYQIALTATGDDNGFVTMFLNLVPALTALISLVSVVVDRRSAFCRRPMFFLGLALIGASLLIFSLKAWREPPGRCEVGTLASQAPDCGPRRRLFEGALEARHSTKSSQSDHGRLASWLILCFHCGDSERARGARGWLAHANTSCFLRARSWHGLRPCGGGAGPGVVLWRSRTDRGASQPADGMAAGSSISTTAGP